MSDVTVAKAEVVTKNSARNAHTHPTKVKLTAKGKARAKARKKARKKENEMMWSLSLC